MNQNQTRTSNERRLGLLQRCGLFTDQAKGSTLSRTMSIADLEGAYRLVHDVFVEAGFIASQSSGLRIRPWETSEDTATFVSKVEGQINGVFSLIVDSSDLGLPSDGPFLDELANIRDEDRLICELTSQAIHKEYRNTAVTTELTRCTYAQAWHGDATELICAISPRQRKFFELIGFVQVGPIRSFSKEIDDPVALMWLEDIQGRWIGTKGDVDPMGNFWKQYFITTNPYMKHIEFWNQRNKQIFNDPALIGGLFAKCAGLFSNASPNHREAMEQRLGVGHMYSAFGTGDYREELLG